MLTRCPACATHFRITPAQLKVRAGSVRCGACQHVFNALDSLVEEPLVVAAPPIPDATPQSVAASLADIDIAADDAAPAETGSDEIAVSPAPTPGLADEVPDEVAIPDPDAREPSIPELAEATAPAVAEPDAVEGDAAGDTDTLQSDWSEAIPEPPPPPRRWPWAVGSVVAFMAIALQAALAFRAELAVVWPNARPALVTLCNAAGCEVGLPTKVALVGIEASDLHPDSESKSRLVLTATLKNRAPFAQTYPHLELTLTDTEDKAVARKVLAPADYLPTATPIPQGMQPGADIAVAVGIDSGELAASGYRLYLFYP